MKSASDSIAIPYKNTLISSPIPYNVLSTQGLSTLIQGILLLGVSIFSMEQQQYLMSDPINLISVSMTVTTSFLAGITACLDTMIFYISMKIWAIIKKGHTVRVT